VKKTAFSLFEISITILIISVLIAGTIQSSKIINKARLTKARGLTENSIVNNLDGLIGWWETSLESSFGNIKQEDGMSIATWHDRNPKALTKNHATQTTSSYQSKLYFDLFNGSIPALRFDGTDDFFSFDGKELANSPYTIFVIEQRRSDNNFKYFLGTDSSGVSTLFLGFRLNNTLTYAHSSSRISFTIPDFDSSKIIPRMHTMLFNTTAGARYWENGGVGSDASNAGQTTALTEVASAGIGRSMTSGNFYNGDIAEVIIFKRNLTTTERRSVEDYLSKKYGLTIS
jgi:type II secretory pathway pseudopilin PulG